MSRSFVRLSHLAMPISPVISDYHELIPGVFRQPLKLGMAQNQSDLDLVLGQPSSRPSFDPRSESKSSPG